MNKKVPNCHPDRPYFAKDKCKQCWGRDYSRAHRRPYKTLSPEYRAKALAKRRQRYKDDKEWRTLKLARDRAYHLLVNSDPARRLKREIQDRETRLKKSYNISLKEYDRKLIAQSGLCALCERPPTKRGLDVDHSHTTGQIRDLLCYRCNATVIPIIEDAVLVEKARAYLARHLKTQKAPAEVNPEPSEVVTLLDESETEQDQSSNS